jgi:hypothetical protein
MYVAPALTGGTKSLDAIDGDTPLVDGDGAIAFIPASFRSYLYTLDADASGSEVAGSPLIVNPDNNPGTKSWVLTYLIEPAKYLFEVAGNPPEPATGEAVIWRGDGTGMGADGDVMIASNVDGTTKYRIVMTYSGATAWGA